MFLASNLIERWAQKERKASEIFVLSQLQLAVAMASQGAYLTLPVAGNASRSFACALLPVRASEWPSCKAFVSARSFFTRHDISISDTALRLRFCYSVTDNESAALVYLCNGPIKGKSFEVRPPCQLSNLDAKPCPQIFDCEPLNLLVPTRAKRYYFVQPMRVSACHCQRRPIVQHRVNI